MTRRRIPADFKEWWDNDSKLPESVVKVFLCWRDTDEAMAVGRLNKATGALRLCDDGKAPVARNPSCAKSQAAPAGEEENTRPTSKKLAQLEAFSLVAQALTRAGWLLPRIDPIAMWRLIGLRDADVRLEFILDTNAMAQGIGHWLVDIFSDRCDLVVTAVTLRELQDAREQASFGKDPFKGGSVVKKLGHRQLYLAANRFRESTDYPRVLWRELEADDTALLLSRGPSSGKKSSESDTLMLRSVRRSIHARVRGLERFFVTGDTALARRAATELPSGSVIAAQTGDASPGDVLTSLQWWPGPNEGRRVERHPSKLVWELLCIGDTVVLVDEETDDRWEFRAFNNTMWPSDYQHPWIDVTPPERLEKGPAWIDVTPPERLEKGPGLLDGTTLLTTELWGHEFQQSSDGFDNNLRIPGKTILDVLSAIVLANSQTVELGSLVNGKEQVRHVATFLRRIDLAELNINTRTAILLGSRDELVKIWNANDLDALFEWLRRWTLLDEWVTRGKVDCCPEVTRRVVRQLATLLGQGMILGNDKVWFPGGMKPSVDEIRRELLAYVQTCPNETISTYDLLIEVFLKRLAVAPARVNRVWEKLWEAGVFEGFEPREGGTSSGKLFHKVARLTKSGWKPEQIDLETCHGIRDLKYRGPS